MTKIEKMILFYSGYSDRCKNVIKFIKHYNIPVVPFSVDSESIRNIIKNGPYFGIKGVPTMVVIYSNDSMELYIGDKIIQWLRQLISQNNESESSEDEEEDEDDVELLDSPPVISSTQGKNMKEQKMADIKNLAKQMEAERKRTLGYDEDKLPSY